jgi:hypothetical protein
MFRIYQQPMTGVKDIEKAVRDNRSREKSLTEGHKTINIPSKRWVYVLLTRGAPKPVCVSDCGDPPGGGLEEGMKKWD